MKQPIPAVAVVDAEAAEAEAVAADLVA